MHVVIFLNEDDDDDDDDEDDDDDDDEYVNDNNMDEMKQKNYACMYEEIERNLSVQKS